MRLHPQLFNDKNMSMKSINFEFLRQDWPQLANIAAFAEQYAHTDAVSSLTKLRILGEQIAEAVYELAGLQRPIQPSFVELLQGSEFLELTPKSVLTVFHALRLKGNKAVHRHEGETAESMDLLAEAHKLARWFYYSFAKDTSAKIETFRQPKPEDFVDETKSKIKREKKALHEQLRAQEAQLELVLEDLKQAREKHKQDKLTIEQLQELRQSAHDGLRLNELNFTEEETRKTLIDQQLADAGWNVKDSNSVGIEVDVNHQPTESSVGQADYILYDDSGNPLAVIEAKKTSKDAGIGKEQARMYADGIEKDTGKRPVIFYTNGYDIWIWDDANGYSPRKILGFYNKDNLKYLHHQRENAKKLPEVETNRPEFLNIVNRDYQIEAVRRVTEKFQNKSRRALIVQATGTGKTRVAIALCEFLLKAGWVKRVLFLCDRKELRKQAKNAFKEFLPDEPQVVVTARTAKDTNQKIYLGTYPALMKSYQNFDVGFFDLIIADESHRSIYNRYRGIFDYFDALQVGLTATPVDYVSRNTYSLFGCDNQDPTAKYEYEDAVSAGHLNPFKVIKHTTEFLRRGIKYSDMNEDQRKELEEQEQLPETIEYEQGHVDKAIFNKDTNRIILHNLMQNGLKVDDGGTLGKTIIFARNHEHAVLLEKLFNERYPQYGGKFCKVIDNYDPRAGALIDEFKEKNNPLTIAISVDMLDTGIDVPEIINLVFAKPVYSYVKFWQMIGRGTRLCENLYGPGQHKTEFLIFDHWGNFEYFDEEPDEPDDKPQPKSLQQLVFESVLTLAETARDKQDLENFNMATQLLHQHVNNLDERTFEVREHWRLIKTIQKDGVIEQFDPATVSQLKTDIAPLMQWVNIKGNKHAWQFDKLCAQLQVAILKNASVYEDLKDTLIEQVRSLRIEIKEVQSEIETIDAVKSGDFWQEPTVADIEQVRLKLRRLMKYRQIETAPQPGAKVLDVTEDQALIETSEHTPKLQGLKLIEYRNRVQRVLENLLDRSPVVQKIKSGQTITPEELEELSTLVIAQEPDLKLEDLREYYPQSDSLDAILRSIVGLDASAVEERFTAFIQSHNLNATQIRFLDLVKNMIARHGKINITDLYDPPFTTISPEGPDGLFDEDTANELIELIQTFNADSDVDQQ